MSANAAQAIRGSSCTEHGLRALRLARASSASVVLVVLLAACAGAEPVGVPPSSPTDPSAEPDTSATAGATSSTTGTIAYRDIEFVNRDGTTQVGRVFGDGGTAIVLSHMGRPGDSQDDWASFAEELANDGYRVLTYTHDRQEVWQDVLGAADYLRESGAQKVIAAGASLGAMASLFAAENPESELDGVLWLAGVMQGSGYLFQEADVAEVACPMLIVSADRDTYDAADDARLLHDWAATDELLILESVRHGTDILAEGGPAADQLRQTMIGFVERVEADSTTC